jgi:hypothetical protein
VLRPTWHFVAAEDIRWMLALTAPRVRTRMAPYNGHLELDERIFARSNKAIEKALEGGRHLTRAELGAALQGAGIGSSAGQRLAHLMMRAELDALVCSGAHRGKEPTYALLDERVPAVRAMQRDEALTELATRYFATRGPATVQDFAWWSGLTVGDAKRGIEAVDASFARTTVGTRTFWFTGDAPGSKGMAPAVHLLPNYDEYFIGHKDRSAIGERVAASKISAPSDAYFAHLVIVNGQLVGDWKRIPTGRRMTVALRLLAKVTARERRAIDVQAARYGEFIGVPVELIERG